MATAARLEMIRPDSECVDPVDPATLENEVLLGFVDLRTLYPEILLDRYLTSNFDVQRTGEEFLPCHFREDITILGHTDSKVFASTDDMSSE